MITYGVFNPQNYTISPITLYNQIDKTVKFLRVQNNSPYQLAVSLDGQITYISEFWQKDVAIPLFFQGNVIVTPSVAILTASHAQAYQLTLSGLTIADGGGVLDGPIPQQAVTATASGNPLFTAFFGLGSSANAVQTLNVFNPANSGVDMIFHAAQVYSNSTGVPQAVLTYQPGADLNLPTAVSAHCHTLQANPPVSNAHVTFADDTGHGNGGTNIETYRSPGRTTQGTIDLLAFPDTVILKPGGNLLLVTADSVAGDVIQLILKWSEQVAIPAPSLAGVPILTAANIVNDGNPTNTGIVEATPSGGSQSVYLTNDGKLTLAGLVTLAGNLVANGGMNINTIRDDVNGNIALDLSNGDGSIKFPQPLQITNAGTAHGGSVGGTVTFYTPIWAAGLKVLLVLLGAYNSAANFSFTLPSSIARGLWIASYNGSSTCAFGSVDVATALGNGTARGADIAEAQIFANSFGSIQVTSAGTFTVNSTAAVAVNGAVLVIGV